MKIVFMGTMHFARIILEALHNRYPVSLVVTQPDRPYGRKQELKASEVKMAAVNLNIPIFQPDRITRDHQVILDLHPDLIVVAAYGQMIPKQLLDLPKYRPINVHASLLPKYRGGAPMQRAIMNGESITGVTVMFMEMKMDSGPVLSQREVPIHLEDDVATLEDRLALAGSELLLETLADVISGKVIPILQDPKKVTYAYNLKPEEERLDFSRGAKAIYDHVRAFHPEPLAYALIDGVKLKIHSVEIIDGKEDSHMDGEIVLVDKNCVYVKSGDKLVSLKEVQMPGKRPMPIKDFLNGYGRKLLGVGKIFE